MVEALKRLDILLLIVWASAATALSQTSGLDGPLAPGLTDSGTRRGNPFATILKKNRENSEEMVRRLSGDDPSESPELFLQTIDLRYINAEVASDAFACLSSEAGKMRAQKGSNSLIVFDTSDNLKRIVAEIEKADRPIKTLTVKAVDLNYLDAKAAAEALLKIASEVGHIVIVPKSNTIIISDILSSMEGMLAEVVKLDQPTAGMIVEPIPLAHIGAQSAQAALVNLLSEFGTISVVDRTNSLVVCDLVKNVNLIREEVEKIDRESRGLAIETVSLKFLQAQKLAMVLTKMLTPFGSVSANEASNSIIVSDTSENLVRVVEEIKRADKTPRQIMVEVVLMDVRLGDDKEIGINWDMLTEMRDPVMYRQNLTTDSERIRSTRETGESLGNATAFNTLGVGAELNIIVGTVRSVVHAIQARRDVEIIASPRAMVLSGQSATIRAVEEIPYTVLKDFSEGGSFATTEFKLVGVTLDVMASITEQDEIFLAVTTEQNVRTGESSGGVPVVDTRSERTSLLLKDGQIVVMGGLRRQEKTRLKSQIPIVGDLPWIGPLFRKTEDGLQNTELVILLSPHIHDGNLIPAEITERVNKLNRTVPITGRDRPSARPTYSTQDVAR